jgi:heptosyltransferase-2
MQIDKAKVRNILAVRTDRFGEFLLIIPALRALHETFPQAKISLICNPELDELAKCIPYINETAYWENTKHPFKEILKFSFQLREKHFDICVIFNPSKEFNIISYFAGIKHRVGYNHKGSFFLNHKIADNKHLELEHEVEYNLDLVSEIGAITHDKSLSLAIPHDIALSALKSFELGSENNLIAIHPWTSDPVKEWPVERFVELALGLNQLSLKVIVIGGRGELFKSKALFDNLGSNVINLTGRTSLVQSAVILKGCRLLVSCDSGPVHLACCMKTPVVTLFRNDIPGKRAKRWGPWGTGNFVIQKPDLSAITVDEVVQKVKEALHL